MTDASNAAGSPPGWYQDPLNPTDPRARRWWNGYLWVDDAMGTHAARGRETFSRIHIHAVVYGLITYTLLALAIAVGLPTLFHDTTHTTTTPMQLLITVTALLNACTIIFMVWLGRMMGWSRRWIVSASIMNVGILLVIFLLEPLSVLYRTYIVQYVVNDNLFGGTSQSGFDPTMGGFAFVSSLTCIYFLAVFMLLYLHHKRRIAARIALDSRGISPYHPNEGPALIMMFIVMCAIYVASWAESGLGEYWSFLDHVLPWIVGILVVVFVAAVLSFLALREKSVSLKSLSAVTTYFWTGATMIIVDHVLWFIYMAMLLSIWPLHVSKFTKVILPSSVSK